MLKRKFNQHFKNILLNTWLTSMSSTIDATFTFKKMFYYT